MATDPRPIGVFDSGVGGLTVFHALEQALPAEAMEKETRLPVVGVIAPGARRAVERSMTGRIGVIGTRATVASGAYKRAIQELRPDAEVLSQACPLFVPLAEEGWTDGDITQRVADSYLGPFKRADVDALVLGCTHYPLLRNVIGEVMGPDVVLVDSAESVAQEVDRRLRDEPALAAPGDEPDRREHHFYVTDAPEPFQVVAERFLGRPIRCLEWASLDKPSERGE